MNLGITLGTLLSYEDVLRCSKVADGRVDLILIPESWGRDAFVTLGCLSMLTSKSMLGSGIVSIYSRTAASIAMATATIDAYSNGRMLLGLGASSKPLVEGWHGLKFKDQVTRMKEYVESIRMILNYDKVSYDGKIVKIKDFRLGFKPIRSKIPIYIAAVMSKMRELAFMLADGLILFLYPFDEVKAIANNIDDRFNLLHVIITSISPDYNKAKERAKKTIAFYTAVGSIYARFLAEHGYDDEVYAIREEYSRNGLDNIHKHVSDDMLDSLAIYGDRHAIKNRFEEFRIDKVTPVLHINPVYDAEQSLRDILSAIGV